MRKFETKVQELKYRVFREVAREAFSGNLLATIHDIPKRIMPGPKPTMRCCVFKERAIIAERIKMAMGGTWNDPNVIEVLDIACDECPAGGYLVSDTCRGCIAHRCEEACPKEAILFDRHQRARIDKEKCVECGRCALACPYSAIQNVKRPCQNACKVKAIDMDENWAARIDGEKCVACGACVAMCPFGAIMDKSYLVNVAHFIRAREKGECGPLLAVVAPTIASQFTYAKLGQAVTGLRRLGFDQVVEAALGADMTAFQEAEELLDAGFLASSCCPAFVAYAERNFPQMAGHISRTLSPMAQVSRHLKQIHPDAKVVFIGPCTAKKMEAKRESVKPYVDSVLTFEEMQALLDSRDIDITALPETPLDGASSFGRVFARCGGVAEAVAQAIRERGKGEFPYHPISCDGLEACRAALIRADKGALPHNFIEGMACNGGCIGGPACLVHRPQAKRDVEKYGEAAGDRLIGHGLPKEED